MCGSTTRKTSTSAPSGRNCEARACVAARENSEPSTVVASASPRTQELLFVGQIDKPFVVLLSDAICDWGHRVVRQM
jgi:hypothetical protein